MQVRSQPSKIYVGRFRLHTSCVPADRSLSAGLCAVIIIVACSGLIVRVRCDALLSRTTQRVLDIDIEARPTSFGERASSGKRNPWPLSLLLHAHDQRPVVLQFNRLAVANNTPWRSYHRRTRRAAHSFLSTSQAGTGMPFETHGDNSRPTNLENPLYTFMRFQTLLR